MRILITGITGRIGANLAAALVRQGHQVRGLVWPRDPRTENLKPLGVELVEGTITSEQDLTHAVEDMEIVYHLGAAFQGGGPFTDSEYFEINVRGTFNMLEVVRQTSGLRQLIFASSDALYDKYVPGGMEGPIVEETPSQPRGAYALSKELGENLCLGYARSYAVSTTILRFAMVRAADEILSFPQFFLSQMRGSHRELENLWDGEERLVLLRDALGRPFKKHIADVRDIVLGCLCALDVEKAFGQIYQLAGPSPFTWEEAVLHLNKLLGIPIVDVEVGGVPTHYEFDLSKAQREINFNPQYGLGRMIEDAWSFKAGKTTDVLPHG